MTISTLENVIERNMDALGLEPGNYSVFAPTKDSGDPIDVAVVPGKFSPTDFAELFWAATLEDSEIDEIADEEREGRDLGYLALLEAIMA